MVLGEDGLGGLAHAVAAALDQGAHVHQHPVDRQGVGSQPGHNLPVEEDGKDAHGDVHEKGGEPRDPNPSHGGERAAAPHQAQGALPREEVGGHEEHGDPRPQAGGNARPQDAQVRHEHQVVVPKDVEHAPGHHRPGGQGGPAVVAEEGRQHLVEEEQGDAELHRVEIGPGQGDQLPFPAEEADQGDLPHHQADPHQAGDDHRGPQGHGKDPVGLPDPALAPVGTVEDGASHTGEHPQTVKNVPHRGHHRQGRRPVGPLVLAHHGHVHQAVHRSQHGAAKGGAQIAKIGLLDVSPQQIHGCSLPSPPAPCPGQQKSRTGQQASQPITLSSLPFLH